MQKSQSHAVQAEELEHFNDRDKCQDSQGNFAKAIHMMQHLKFSCLFNFRNQHWSLPVVC